MMSQSTLDQHLTADLQKLVNPQMTIEWDVDQVLIEC